MFCRLCLTETDILLPLKNVKPQEEDEEAEDIAGIIEKHFDLPLDVNSDLVCTVCWQQVKEFHTFYLFIEEKQKELSQQSKLPALTSTNSTETEYEMVTKDAAADEMVTKDAAADEMHKRNKSIIDIKNTPMVLPPMIPDNAVFQLNKYVNGNLGKVFKANDYDGAENLNFQCLNCPRKFEFEYLLITHRIVNHREGRIKCNECNEEYSLSKSLYEHKKTVHPRVRTVVCDICNKQFSTKITCAIHKSSAHNIGDYHCPHCPRKFAYEYMLNTHKKESHKQKKFMRDESGEELCIIID